MTSTLFRFRDASVWTNRNCTPACTLFAMNLTRTIWYCGHQNTNERHYRTEVNQILRTCMYCSVIEYLFILNLWKYQNIKQTHTQTNLHTGEYLSCMINCSRNATLAALMYFMIGYGATFTTWNAVHYHALYAWLSKFWKLPHGYHVWSLSDACSSLSTAILRSQSCPELHPS